MRIASNQVEDVFGFAYKELAELYSRREVDHLLFELFNYYLSWDQIAVLKNKKERINQSDLLKFNFAIKDLKKEKPIQYVIGEASFYGRRFYVNEDVLIPRPETEELVHLLLKHNQLECPHIMDLCTGSACIAISLALEIPSAKLYALDISEKALEQAKRNAQRHSVTINTFCADILKAPDTKDAFDYILSNPPYVLESDKLLMKNNVLNYEPHLALFVPNEDPLKFYKAIADYMAKHLKIEGSGYLEIHEAYGQEITCLAQQYGFQVEIYKDINGKDRICHIQRQRTKAK